jgi:hypothetical protein
MTPFLKNFIAAKEKEFQKFRKRNYNFGDYIIETFWEHEASSLQDLVVKIVLEVDNILEVAPTILHIDETWNSAVNREYISKDRLKHLLSSLLQPPSKGEPTHQEL